MSCPVSAERSTPVYIWVPCDRLGDAVREGVSVARGTAQWISFHRPPPLPQYDGCLVYLFWWTSKAEPLPEPIAFLALELYPPPPLPSPSSRAARES
jgi:hypothetical protein